MSLYVHGLDIGLDFGICELSSLVQTIIFCFFFIELESLCRAIFL